MLKSNLPQPLSSDCQCPDGDHGVVCMNGNQCGVCPFNNKFCECWNYDCSTCLPKLNSEVTTVNQPTRAIEYETSIVVGTWTILNHQMTDRGTHRLVLTSPSGKDYGDWTPYTGIAALNEYRATTEYYSGTLPEIFSVAALLQHNSYDPGGPSVEPTPSTPEGPTHDRFHFDTKRQALDDLSQETAPSVE